MLSIEYIFSLVLERLIYREKDLTQKSNLEAHKFPKTNFRFCYRAGGRSRFTDSP